MVQPEYAADDTTTTNDTRRLQIYPIEQPMAITAPPAVRRNGPSPRRYHASSGKRDVAHDEFCEHGNSFGPSPRRYHASSGKCAVAHDEFRELAFVGRKLGEVGLGNWKGERTAIVGWRVCSFGGEEQWHQST